MPRQEDQCQAESKNTHTQFNIKTRRYHGSVCVSISCDFGPNLCSLPFLSGRKIAPRNDGRAYPWFKTPVGPLDGTINITRRATGWA